MMMYSKERYMENLPQKLFSSTPIKEHVYIYIIHNFMFEVLYIMMSACKVVLQRTNVGRLDQLQKINNDDVF